MSIGNRYRQNTLDLDKKKPAPRGRPGSIRAVLQIVFIASAVSAGLVAIARALA